MNIFNLLTPITYWLLIGMWLFILLFYLRRLRFELYRNSLLVVLFVILTIDAFRTLFESIYFGAWYSSVAGLLPIAVHDFLVRPEMVIIPKLTNVISAALVIAILFRHWLPREGEELSRLEVLVRQRTDALEQTVAKLESEVVAHKQVQEQLTRKVTELERVEAALQESEFRYRTVADQAYDWEYWVNPDLSLRYVSPACERISGFSAAEFIDNPSLLSEIVLPADRERWQAHLRQQKTQRVAAEVQFRITHRNGEVRWVEHACRPVRDQDETFLGYRVSNRDVTERKAAVQALRMAQSELEARVEERTRELCRARDVAETANLAKSEFLASVSHEIRTPMNGVVGLCHLALQTELSAKQREYLEKIQVSAYALLSLINNILDISRIEAGRFELEALDFRLEEVLERLAALVVPQAEAKGIALFFQIEPQVPLELVGDPLRLGQILLNLVGNAVKFTESGEILVSCRLLPTEDETLTLRFAVRDTGIGLNPQQIDKIFANFAQADPSTCRRYGGSGLGLTICSQLADLMGGELQVESQPGVGSCFSFTARLARRRGDKRRRLAAPPDLRGMRVLVVDAQGTSRQLLREQLESFGFRVVVAADSEEGLAQLRESAAAQPVRLVLIDLQVAGQDGSEIVRQLRSLCRPRPIIVSMVNPYAPESQFESAVVAAVDGFLPKPISPSTLLDTMMQFLGHQGSKRRLQRTRLPAALAMKRLRGARLLVVEDNEINRLVARELLERAGLQVTEAVNGRQALERLADNDFDAVLMDIQMPELDGFQATARIHGDGRHARLPIIGMTAHAMTGDRQLALKAGMNDYLTKPIDPDELFAVLGRWIAPRADQAAGEPLVSLAGPLDAVSLPELPGIDVAAALTRVQGNRSLLLRLLEMFRISQAATMERLQAAVAAADLEEARLQAHALKGVAGNLGAAAVQSAAQALEAALKQQATAQLPACLAELDTALKLVLDSLAGLKAEPPATPVPLAGDTDPGPLLRELAQLLKSNDTRARACLERLRASAGPRGAEPGFERLAQLLAKYDFPAALELLTRLTRELNLSPAAAEERAEPKRRS